MTAEIAVLNKEVLVLATDSAVTAYIQGKPKISPYANKLFALSLLHPVGIMIYNRVQFMGVPMETLIKQHRREIPAEGFETVKEYADAFMGFLEREGSKVSLKATRNYVVEQCTTGFIELTRGLENAVSEAYQRDSTRRIDFEEFALSYLRHIQAEMKRTRARPPFVPLARCREHVTQDKDLIWQRASEVFPDLASSDEAKAILLDIAARTLSRHVVDSYATGIVVGGFGEKEYFPTVVSYGVEGVLEGVLKMAPDHREEQGVFAVSDDEPSRIVPFARTDIVSRFMNGVDPKYTRVEATFMDSFASSFITRFVGLLERYDVAEREGIAQALRNHAETLLTTYRRERKMFLRRNFSGAVVRAVTVLPRSELATLAESLVSLTSLGVRFSPEAETVSEPIDVAVISRGDGFVWVKRKHYFNADINPDFFVRRRIGVENASQLNANGH